jgi:hypothetical protein
VPAKGYTQSAAHRAKIAATRRGQKHTEKTKRAISAAMVASHRARADDRALRRAIELEEWREAREQKEIEEHALRAYEHVVAVYGQDAVRGMTPKEVRVRYELRARLEGTTGDDKAARTFQKPS